MKVFGRIMLPLLVALFYLVSAQPALAQSSGQTWMPAFEPGRHVYLDSRLENHPTNPVRFPNLNAHIERAQKSHGLKIYVVALEQGSESSPSSGLATKKLDELILKWSQDPNFPRDDYLVLMWVRYKDDPSHGSVAGNGGNRLRAYGMSASHFSSGSGPLVPAVKRHMRNNPELALSETIDNVNAEVVNAIASEIAERERAEQMKKLPGIVLRVVIFLSLLGFGIWLVWRYFANRGRARELLFDFEQSLSSLTSLIQKVKKDHGRFLETNSDWKGRFKGDSLTRFQEGFSAYGDLLAISAAASKRVDEVKRAWRHAWFPFVGGYRQAVVLLTQTTVKISEKAVDLESATLFGGLTKERNSRPQDLFDNTDSLASTADSCFAEIKTALADCQRESDTAGGTITWARGEARQALEKHQLVLTPYEPAISDLEQKKGDFYRLASNNPLGARALSQDLLAADEQLRQTINDALSLAVELEDVRQAITGTEENVAELRRTGVQYKFPGKPERVLAKFYRLDEENGNPDPLVSQAKRILASAFKHLLQGRRDDAQETLKKAEEKRLEAETLTVEVFSAKEHVETEAAKVSAARDELATALSGALKALTTLRSDFLAANITDAVEQHDRASALKAMVDTRFTELHSQYANQAYLKAKTLLAQLLEDIDKALQDAKAVEERLAVLSEYKTISRNSVRQSRRHAARLGPLLKERSFSTSTGTDVRLQNAVRELCSLEGTVNNPIEDWVAANQRTTALATELSDIESTSDTELADYELTVELVQALPADLEDAYLAISQRTLALARQAHATACQEIEALAPAIDVAKSDWAALKARAQEAGKLCQKVRDAAAADERCFVSARLHLAYCATRSRRYARRKHRSLTEARRLYALAQTAFAERKWQEANNLASSAYKHFLSYDRHNKRRVATLVVKGAPGVTSKSAPATASGSNTSSDDSFATGVAIAIGMSMGESSNPSSGYNHGSGSSGSTSTTSSNTPDYTPSYSPPSYSPPSYSSDSGGGGFSIDTGGGGFGGGSGGTDY